MARVLLAATGATELYVADLDAIRGGSGVKSAVARLFEEFATPFWVDVGVNAVRPGLIHTDMHASGGEPTRIARLQDSVPLQRGGEAVEVAHAVLWLLSAQASYVTGALLDVAGGR